MSEWWSFYHVRLREIVWFLLVCKKSPIAQTLPKDVQKYLAKFIRHQVCIEQCSKLQYMNKHKWEKDLVLTQRTIIMHWMNQHVKQFILGRRTGKSFILSQLMRHIPTHLNILCLVPSWCQSDWIPKQKNISIAYSDSYVDTAIFDFIFAENVEFMKLKMLPFFSGQRLLFLK